MSAHYFSLKFFVFKDSELPDATILWKVNYIRFHWFFRDQLIIQLIKDRLDEVFSLIYPLSITHL